MNGFARALVFLAGLLLLTVMGGGAAVASGPASVEIASGGLQLSGPGQCGTAVVTLDGSARDVHAAMGDFTIVDARGEGVGWRVFIQAGQLTTGGAAPRTLPLGSLSMSQRPRVVKVDGTSSAAPAIWSGPYILDSGSAIQVASAAGGEGMGSYRFSFPGAITVKVDPDAFPGTYSCTITVLVVSGP
jgi:hypothetical protein